MISRIWNKFTGVISAVSVLVCGAWAAKPPATKAEVSHPTTQVAVNKPTTKVEVSKPETKVQVFHPVTTVVVQHPQTPSATASDNKKGDNATLIATKQPAPTSMPANEQNKSMMSSYKAPQAKDFKAAATGGGEAGLGNKTNQAEKDAAAAAFQTPKAESASLSSLSPGADGNLRSKISKEVNKSTK